MESPWALAVFIGGQVRQYPLPPSGRLVLGRAESCDIRLDDPSVSRRHALLHVGPALTIEDAGSAHGTWLRPNENLGEGTAEAQDQRLPPGVPTPLAPDTLVRLGSVALVVRPGPGAAQSPGLPPATSEGPSHVIVQDEAMRRLYALATRVARGSLSVLLLGETGVGKEVLAETLHARSPRAGGPFVRLHCAALSETLLESELFGYEKGAFTGAQRTKPGLIEVARGGTLFLDEVGELPMAVQVKLLRVLEDRKVLRVGGLEPRDVDVRFVAATHRDLDAHVVGGSFRQDLYFRLNGFTLTIPPLRERVAEIAHLARLFIERAAAEQHRAAPRLTDAARVRLEGHSWPGNIRELRNVMGRALVLCQDDAITPEHLVFDGSAPAPTPPPLARRADTPPPAPEPGPSTLRDDIAALERQRLVEALERCAGNQTEAAKLLGISRRTLVTRLGTYGLPRPRRR